METITSSPSEYRLELETSCTNNYEKLLHARKQPGNQDLIDTFELRMNNRLEAIRDLIGDMAVGNA